MATALTQRRDQAAWEARAIVLAEEAHATGTARWIGRNDFDAQLYRVPSWSHDGAQHVVTVWRTGDVLCTCTAGSYGRPCKHAGSALYAEKQRQAAMTSRTDEGLRTFAHGGQW